MLFIYRTSYLLVVFFWCFNHGEINTDIYRDKSNRKVFGFDFIDFDDDSCRSFSVTGTMVCLGRLGGILP